MLNRVIEFSLRNRLFVIAAAALLLVYGALILVRLPVDVFPDLNRPTVTIMIEAGGLAPEEVETLVTLPIETLMNGAPGVRRVRSSSGIGLAIIFVEFDWGTNIYTDRQLVAEKLQLAAGRLPAGVTPVLGPISSIMGEIMLISMASESGTTSPMEVRTLADWVVRQRLLTIPGVSQVIPIGGAVKQYQVLPSPAKLAQYDISLNTLEEAIARFGQNTTGGFLDAHAQEYLVRNIGRTTSIEDLANTVVAYRDGIPVLARNVAEVRFGAKVKRGDASVNGKPAVILSIQKQPGANTVALTRQVETALDEIQQTLPADIRINKDVFKQANFIEHAVENVVEALRDGSILVVIVLFLFLLNFRTTAITLTAIPLSLVVSGIVFKLFDISINTMTLGGLAVAIGELVDDAIVDVENVFRRLKENRAKPEPDNPLRVIYAASSEVRNSIVFATIIVVLVFLPLFALGGIEGRIFAPLGIAYITSIIASLVVSLTVTPALCSYLLPTARFMHKEGDSPLVRWLKRQDERLLHHTLRHPNVVIVGALIMVLVAAGTVPFMGREFLPEFNEGTATINVLSPPGTSLAESNRIGTIAEQLLLSVPEVKSTGRRTGRAELDEHAEGVHSTEIEVDLKESGRSRAEILGEIRAKLGQIPGVALNIGQPISHRLDHLLSGIRAQVAVKVFGPDLDTLRAKAAEVEAAMRTVPGVVDLQTEKQVLIPQIRVQLKRDEAKKYGVQVGDLAEVLETAFAGKVVNQVLDGQRTFEVVVWFDEGARRSIEDIRNALIDTPSGATIPLASVAQVEESLGPNLVNHDNVQRRIVVQCNTAERDLNSVIQDIQTALAERVKLPPGYFLSFEGQFQSQQEATRLIALLSAFSLAGMFLVLYAHFKSGRIVLQVLLNIPLSLIGSVLAIYLTSGVFSVATLVGFITLCGIASRNGIMMLSHYLHLMQHEGEQFTKEMIIRGSLERLVPVLMTALTAALALVPLALAAGAPGKEILHPVAVVILGGLMSSTLLDQVVTPAVFWRFGKPAVESIRRAEAEGDVFATLAAPEAAA